MESIKGFTLGGLVPPMEITAADHEGGGWVADLDGQGRQARARTKDWFQGYRPTDPEAPRGRRLEVLNV